MNMESQEPLALPAPTLGTLLASIEDRLNARLRGSIVQRCEFLEGLLELSNPPTSLKKRILEIEGRATEWSF